MYQERSSAVFVETGDCYDFCKRRVRYKRRVIHWLL